MAFSSYMYYLTMGHWSTFLETLKRPVCLTTVRTHGSTRRCLRAIPEPSVVVPTFLTGVLARLIVVYDDGYHGMEF